MRKRDHYISFSLLIHIFPKGQCMKEHDRIEHKSRGKCPGIIRWFKWLVRIFKSILIAVVVAIILFGIVFWITCFATPDVTIKNWINKIEIKDWILLIAALLVVAGWIIKYETDIEYDKFKRRLDHRLGMLKDFLPIATVFYKYGTNPFYYGRDLSKDCPELIPQLEKSQIDFEIYGYRDERDAMNMFVKALIPKPDKSKFQDGFNIIVPLVRERIREELDIGEVYV